MTPSPKQTAPGEETVATNSALLDHEHYLRSAGELIRGGKTEAAHAELDRAAERYRAYLASPPACSCAREHSGPCEDQHAKSAERVLAQVSVEVGHYARQLDEAERENAALCDRLASAERLIASQREVIAQAEIVITQLRAESERQRSIWSRESGRRAAEKRRGGAK